MVFLFGSSESKVVCQSEAQGYIDWSLKPGERKDKADVSDTV